MHREAGSRSGLILRHQMHRAPANIYRYLLFTAKECYLEHVSWHILALMNPCTARELINNFCHVRIITFEISFHTAQDSEFQASKGAD